MNLETDIIVKSKKWHNISNAERLVDEICQKLVPHIGLKKLFPRKAEQFPIICAISLVSDFQIRKINKQYRKKDKPTNVLSFPALDFDNSADLMPPGQIFLGDIVISYDRILLEAKKQKKDFIDHLTHLILHSMLHLIGYDHENEKDAPVMENLEVKILKKMNINNPY